MSANSLGSRAIIGSYWQALEVATGQFWIDKLVMDFDSDQEKEEYRWLGQVPTMREWIGGRNPRALRDNGITIRNKKFEATLIVTLDEIRRDKTSQVLKRIAELADRTVTHDAALLSTLMIGNGVCYDGQNFFDTDHAEGESGTQANLITYDISDTGTGGSPTAPTSETMAQAIFSAITSIIGFKDDVGEPMNEMARQFLVMTPTNLAGAALSALRLPFTENGKSNILPATDFNITQATNPRLTDTDKFMVFRTDGQVKPFIRQIEVPVQIDAQAEGSKEEFENDRHLYGVKKIGNVGLGLWQHAVQVDLNA